MHDMTVPTGMFQVAMEHERPRMQSQTACQSTGQDVRPQIDLDTLLQDDFDLAGSAPAGQRRIDDADLEAGTAHDAAGIPRKKKTRRLSAKPGRGRKTKY